MLVLSGLAAFALARWRGHGRWPAAAGLALALGFAAAQLEAHSVAAPVLAHRVNGVLAGRVLAVDPLPEGVRLIIAPSALADLAPAGLPARVRVRLRHGDGGVVPGDGVRLRVSLESPPAPAMPGAYDFQRRAWFDRLGGVGYALSAPERIATQAPGAVAEAIEAVRQAVTRRIRAALPGPNGAIAAALITGETHAIPPNDADAFRDAGLAHILVIAGFAHGHGRRHLLLRAPRVVRADPADRTQPSDQEIRRRTGAVVDLFLHATVGCYGLVAPRFRDDGAGARRRTGRPAQLVGAGVGAGGGRHHADDARQRDRPALPNVVRRGRRAGGARCRSSSA